MNNKIKINTKKLLAALIVIAAVIGLIFIIPLLNGALNGSVQAAENPVRYHGDVDDDGEVTAADARLALRACVGLEDYAHDSLQFARADYDKDGEITASDARMILRTAVALEPLIESDFSEESAELPLSPEEEERLRAEEEAKKKDHEQQPAPSETEPAPEGPVYQGDGINTCMVCGLPCRPDEYGNDACAFGGCTRSFASFTCMHCGENVPANTCHTCTNPTYIITEEPEK